MRRIHTFKFAILLVTFFFSISSTAASESALEDESKHEKRTLLVQNDEENTTLSETIESEGKSENEGDQEGDHHDEDTGGVAALAAGGVVASGSTFPLSLTASLNNQVGVGVFSPGSYNTPSWQTNLSLTPALRIPKKGFLPATILSARLSFGLEWLNNFQSAGYGLLTGTRQRQLIVSDFTLNWMFPNLFAINKAVNFNITPTIRLVAPISAFSRQQNRLLGGGGSLRFQLSKTTKGGTTLGAIYTPSFTLWSHHARSPTINTSDELVINATTCRALDQGDGGCNIPGRTTIGNVANSLVGFLSGGGGKSGSHTIAAAVGTWHVFNRALANDSDRWSSEYAATGAQSRLQAEFTFGDISYTWGLPTKRNYQLTAGVTSFQPLRTRDNEGIRFPFFDFNLGKAGNNFTALYLNLTTSF